MSCLKHGYLTRLRTSSATLCMHQPMDLSTLHCGHVLAKWEGKRTLNPKPETNYPHGHLPGEGLSWRGADPGTDLGAEVVTYNRSSRTGFKTGALILPRIGCLGYILV